MSSNNSAVICLSHQLDTKNNLSFDSIERLKKACSIFHKNDCEYLITTGWKYKQSLNKPLSQIMSKFAQEKYRISIDQIYEEPNAKDTVGEAFFVKKNFFQKFNDINFLHVVTSNWHLDRAKEIFDYRKDKIGLEGWEDKKKKDDVSDCALMNITYTYLKFVDKSNFS